MSYSQIVGAGLASASHPARLIQQAWHRYCAAREVPFESSHPGAWRREFHRLAADGEALLRRHAIEADSATAGPLARTASITVRSLRGQRMRLIDTAAELARQAAAADPATLWHVVELTEACIRLEMETARYHNQLAALFEAAAREPLAAAR